MTGIDWKTKLCSRKLWMAIAGLVSGILLAFKVGENDVSAIGGIILSTGSVIAYILGEGWADAAGASAVGNILPEIVEQEGTADE